MNVLVLIIVMAAHWVFDFCLQTHKMATRKSYDVSVLTQHVSVYTLWSIPLALMYKAPLFIGWVFITHWLVDFVTSKITSELWMRDSYHNFFVVVGLDQLLHFCSIVAGLWAIGAVFAS